MIASDRPAFARLMTTLSSIHNRKLDPAIIAAYFDALADLPLEVVEQAAGELEKHHEHMPKPTHWRAAVQRIRRGQPSTFVPPVLTPDGSAESAYFCLRCEDTGWRPSCRCDLGRLDMSHRCPEHGGEGVDGKAPINMQACACRVTNPAFNRNRGEQLVETR